MLQERRASCTYDILGNYKIPFFEFQIDKFVVVCYNIYIKKLVKKVCFMSMTSMEIKLPA